uniref:Spsb3 protein n=1 Tax=Fopius arisanus TaxID=64838 RepID=A0A0C9RPP5_9HYME
MTHFSKSLHRIFFTENSISYKTFILLFPLNPLPAEIITISKGPLRGIPLRRRQIDVVSIQMVGVGTEKAQLDVWEKFCSLLGMTKDSWGFSYTGRIQHAGESRHYAMPFGQGSIVGVHLDTWRGTLQFFLNRRPLGIAFTGLRGLQLYPMVSSTAARSSVRITHSCSAPASLQMECLALLRPFQKRYLTVIFPGLKYLTQSILADVLSINRNDDEDEDEYEFPEEHLILDDFDFALVGYGRRKKKRRVIFPETESLEISP